MTTFAQYLLLSAIYMSEHKEQRPGQAYFNVLYIHRPHLADFVRGGDLDSFHRDELIPVFLAWLAPEWDAESEGE